MPIGVIFPGKIMYIPCNGFASFFSLSGDFVVVVVVVVFNIRRHFKLLFGLREVRERHFKKCSLRTLFINYVCKRLKKHETNLDASVLKQGPNIEVLKEHGVFTR